MCGIVGIYGQDSELHSRVQKMTSALYHRGPDDEGFYFGNNIGLGMRRLAIIDLKSKENIDLIMPTDTDLFFFTSLSIIL